MSEQIGIDPILPHGLMLANQTVQKPYAKDPLGDRYTVLFGTTNRTYNVNVSYGADAPFTLADYEAHLTRTSALRHPCLIGYFACGENEDVVWIRSEHADGVPDWVTTSVTPDGLPAEGQSDEDVHFPTLRALMDGAGEQISQKDRNLIIGDLAEAIAYLHEHDSYAGVLTPETIFLEKAPKRSELIARLRFYAWPETTTPQHQWDDLRQAGELILLLLSASQPTRLSRLDKALVAFAKNLLASDSVIDGQTFYETVCDILEEHGDFHKPRTEKRVPSYAADGSELQPFAVPNKIEAAKKEGSKRHHSPRRRHRNKSKSRHFDSNSATGQMVSAVFRGLLIFAGIVGVGFGVYYSMRYSDERRRENTRISSSMRYSAISIIEDEEEQTKVAQLPADIRDYTPEQLQLASGQGNAIATARLAILTLSENPTDAEVQAEAASILSPHMSRLEIIAANDPIAAYWCAYVQLLGIDASADSDQAVARLNQAIAGGMSDAHILLGDWLAKRAPKGSPENDRQAMQHWRTAYGRPTKWTSTHLDAIARIIVFIRSNRGYKLDDAELGELIVHAATAGYLDAMLLVSECYDSGLLLEKNASTALSWLRRIIAHAGIKDAMRAETQRRMADMFAEGRGTPPSLSAARIWYERAAKLGNRQAMLTLAEFCETGRGHEGDKRSPEEARYWRNQAESAPLPPPSDTLPSRLIFPPVL